MVNNSPFAGEDFREINLVLNNFVVTPPTKKRGKISKSYWEHQNEADKEI